MSARRLARGLEAYLRTGLGSGYAVSTHRIREFAAYKAEIDAGRPVAVKFDKWFSLRWKGRYAFDYHWTVGIGYEIAGGERRLIVQDNGAGNADGGYSASRERRIGYKAHADVLAMVSVTIEPAPGN